MNLPRTPTDLRYDRARRVLTVCYVDGDPVELSAEYLRVYSPSAEVRGHGGGEPLLLLEKESVGIERIEPIGRYAVRLVFSDGHNTGLYSWAVLHELIEQQSALWARYLERLARAGFPHRSTVKPS